MCSSYFWVISKRFFVNIHALGVQGPLNIEEEARISSVSYCHLFKEAEERPKDPQ